MAVFVDTNVFLYAIDTANTLKQEVAKSWISALWKAQRGRTSFQVLEEFYSKIVKKWPGAQEQTKAEIRDLLAWQPIKIEGAVLESAWRIEARYKLSFWDSLIVASAKAASCRYLLTEDLQHNQLVDGIRVLDPFQSDPKSIEN